MEPKDQYLMLDVKFIQMFQDMFETVSDFIIEWEHFLLYCTANNIDVPYMLQKESSAMKKILSEFAAAAENDLADRTFQGMAGEA